MADVDFKQIENEVVALATKSFKGAAEAAITDGKAFLGAVETQLVTLAQQHERGDINDAEYQDGQSDLKALAKMEAIKEAGLAEIAIANFVNGITDIVVKAALAALP